MKKQYIAPTMVVVLFEAENMLATSSDSGLTISKGSVSGNITDESSFGTQKKNPIWGEEESSGPWK
ncbi:MAG: hypothetical protein ACI3X6_04725 [Alloprevotella sp.]